MSCLSSQLVSLWVVFLRLDQTYSPRTPFGVYHISLYLSRKILSLYYIIFKTYLCYQGWNEMWQHSKYSVRSTTFCNQAVTNLELFLYHTLYKFLFHHVLCAPSMGMLCSISCLDSLLHHLYVIYIFISLRICYISTQFCLMLHLWL